MVPLHCYLRASWSHNDVTQTRARCNASVYVTQQDILLNEYSGLNQNCIRPGSILPTVWGDQFTLSEEDSFHGTMEELAGL